MPVRSGRPELPADRAGAVAACFGFGGSTGAGFFIALATRVALVHDASTPRVPACLYRSYATVRFFGVPPRPFSYASPRLSQASGTVLHAVSHSEKARAESASTPLPSMRT